jgi:hypothetical protein
MDVANLESGRIVMDVDANVLQGCAASIFRVKMLMRMWPGYIEEVTLGEKK